jgi:hypothetical protein
MEALCHQPFGLGRQSSVCCVRLLILGTTKAFVAFLASLGWRPSATPTHYLDTLLTFQDHHGQSQVPIVAERAVDMLYVLLGK